MKKVFYLLFFLSLVTLPASANPIKYYRVDNVITLAGKIDAVKTEKCYRQKKDFIVLYITAKEKNYRVEVSPQWFYQLDLTQGAQIEVTGSYSHMNNLDQIITSKILYQGKVYLFRDKNGFPLWQGKRKQKGRSSMGKRMRKGRR